MLLLELLIILEYLKVVEYELSKGLNLSLDSFLLSDNLKGTVFILSFTNEFFLEIFFFIEVKDFVLDKDDLYFFLFEYVF